MKRLVFYFIFSTLPLCSNAQVLEFIKSKCEERAIAWANTVRQTYRGNMSISDAKELDNNKIKVMGYYDIYTSNCELKRTYFECELKKILDSVEILSFCRHADICVWGVSSSKKWYCYPD